MRPVSTAETPQDRRSVRVPSAAVYHTQSESD
jgi:hypothetical protein